MTTLTKAMSIGALVLALGGCAKDEVSTVPNFRGEYASASTIAEKVETFTQLEGKIVGVQPSQISFIGNWYGGHGAYATGGHELVYVTLQTDDGKLHTLFYPYSKAVLEKDATVKFRPIPSGMMTAGTFIDTFMDPEYFTDDNIVIEAEGAITKNGISYK